MTGWRPNLDWITPSLAVGGSFPIERAASLAEDHGVRAIVDLRSECCDDEAALRPWGIEFLHLPTDDMCAVTVERLETGVAFVRPRLERGRKVLIHCEHGIGRSALLALCVLVDRGLPPMQALTLAKDKRFRVSPSAAQHRGWCDWLEARGLVAPDYHSFGCVAYRRLQAV